MTDDTTLDELTRDHMASLKLLREAETSEVAAYRDMIEEAREDKDRKALAEIRPLMDSAGRSLRRTILLEQRLAAGKAGRVTERKVRAAERDKAVRARKDEITFAMVDAIDRPGVSPERIDSLYAELDRWIDQRCDEDEFLTTAVNDLIEEAGARLGLDLAWELAPDPSYSARPVDFAPAETLSRPHRTARPAAPRARRAAARARALNSS